MATSATLPAATRSEPAAALVMERYRLVRRLGTGGFGAVWLAQDLQLGRDVALKAVPRHGGSPDRAQREALAAARLNHPGIVALYEAGEDAHGTYLVSELVHGETLATLVAAGTLSDRDVLRIGVALADALAHAHARGVVHRDVKPPNVIIPARPESEAGVAKLTDFGIATLVDDEPLTRTGDVVGTLAYMAPEQAEGRRVGPEADLYALALVLYEALAGTHPVRGAGPAATARRLGATLPSLGRTRRGLPAPLVAAIDRGLLPDPLQRGTVAGLRDVLADQRPEVSDEGGALPAPRRVPRLPRATGRVAAACGAAGLAALATTAASAPATAPVAALVAGLAVLALPRVAWLLAGLAVVVWLAAPPVREPGTALLVAVALAPVACLLPRAGRWWSAPALAPLLGAAALAGAFPAVAGQARGAVRRAALGALGAWWIVLAEALSQTTLLLGPAPGTLPPGDWTASARAAWSGVAEPLLTGGALIFALAWAAGAVVLPWLVRGRSLLADAAAATVWAAGLAAAVNAAATAVTVEGAHPDPRGGVLGAILGAVLAVLAARLRHAPPPGAEAVAPSPMGSDG